MSRSLELCFDGHGWITGWGGIDPQTSIYSLFRSPAGRIDAQVARPYAFRFDYDGLGHVSEVRAYTGGQVLRQFGYDPTGDRTSMTVGGQKQSYLYEASSHRLTLADGKTRRYDAAGNTIGIGDATLDFDAAGRLASVSEQGKALVTYGYDALGQRLVRRAIAAKETIRFVYDENGRWLADYDEAGELTRQAVWLGDYLVAIVDHGAVLFVEPDHLGGPRAIIDPQRNLAIWRWHPTDDPFGTAAPDEDPDADGSRFVFDLRFPGQRYDDLTGLHYNYFRDYDPVTGRYVEVDPIGLAGGINPYLYANGAPLAYSDPTGELGIAGVIIGAVIELGSQAFENYRKACDVLNYENYNWTQVGGAAALGAVAPGWISVGKKGLTSARAISTLSSQLSRSRTANRINKLSRRIDRHRIGFAEQLIPQAGFQAAGAVFKLKSSRSSEACGCSE